jgi:hypothetical protein
MESESLLPLERVALEDDLEPRTSFLDLIVVLTSKMFCRMKLKRLFAPRQERQIKLKMHPGRQRNPVRLSHTNRVGGKRKLQIPSSNIQTTPKLQPPNNVRLSLRAWSLLLLWCLDVGAWNFPA